MANPVTLPGATDEATADEGFPATESPRLRLYSIGYRLGIESARCCLAAAYTTAKADNIHNTSIYCDHGCSLLDDLEETAEVRELNAQLTLLKMFALALQGSLTEAINARSQADIFSLDWPEIRLRAGIVCGWCELNLTQDQPLTPTVRHVLMNGRNFLFKAHRWRELALALTILREDCGRRGDEAEAEALGILLASCRSHMNRRERRPFSRTTSPLQLKDGVCCL